TRSVEAPGGPRRRWTTWGNGEQDAPLSGQRPHVLLAQRFHPVLLPDGPETRRRAAPQPAPPAQTPILRAPRLVDGEHLERRVPGRDGADLVVGRVRPHSLEEDP